MVNQSETPYCSVCKKKFSTFGYLKIHERIHTGEKPYKCSICNKAFAQSSNHSVHERMHTREESYKYSVSQWEYSQSSQREVHEKIHTSEKPYKCSVSKTKCSKSIPLEVHEKNSTGEKLYKCSVCEQECSHFSQLEIHERIHKLQKPYKCSVCKMEYSQSSQLEIHEKIHIGEKPYKCSICQKTYSQPHNLRIHERIHTGVKPYRCSVCSKQFYRSDKCRVHERIHTGEKPYKCLVCGKAFSRSDKLKVHERIHIRGKPHECSKCKKTFIRPDGLKNHERIVHGDVKPYLCLICGKAFCQPSALKKHERTHQGERPVHASDICKPEISFCSTSKDFTLHNKNDTTDTVLDSDVLSDKPKILEYGFGDLMAQSEQKCGNHVCYVCNEVFRSYFRLRKHRFDFHEKHTSRILRNVSKSNVHISSGTLSSRTHNERDIKPIECILCKEKFKTKYFLTKHIRMYHGNTPLNFSCVKVKRVTVKKHKYRSRIQIRQKEGVRLKNQNVANNAMNFEVEENGFVQNFDLESNRLSREREWSDQIRSLEAIDIKTEVSVYESYAELQANNDSELCEEILIKEEEIPIETDSVHSLTFQAEDINVDCDSVYDNCSDEETQISEACQTGADHGNTAIETHTESTPSTSCSRLEEPRSSRESDNESLEAVAQGYRDLTTEAIKEYNSDEAETARPDTYSSVMIKKEYPSNSYWPSYKSRDKPYCERLGELFNRPSNSQDVPCSITKRNLDILYASSFESKVVDDWMNDYI